MIRHSRLFWFAALAAVLGTLGCEREPPRRTHTTEAPAQAAADTAPAPLPTLGAPPRAPQPEPSTPEAETPLPRAEHWLGRPPGPALVDPGDLDEVLARVDDQTVTLREVDLQLRGEPMGGPGLLSSPQGRARFAEQAVDFVLLAREAHARGLSAHPAARFERLLGQVEALRLVTLEEAAAKGASDAEVAAFYETHRERFVRPELRAGNQLIAPTLEEARAAREQLLERAPQAAATRTRTFEHMAHKFAAPRGGRLPLVASPDDAQAAAWQAKLGTSAVDEAVARALFGQDLYEVSEPVALADGRHALVLTGHIVAARTTSPQEAADTIRQALEVQRGPQAYDALRERLLAEATPTVDATALDPVRVAKGKGSAALSIPEAHAATPVVTAGETVIDAAMATEALGRWPRMHQQAVLDGREREAFVARLSEIAVLAEAARAQGLAEHPRTQLAEARRLNALVAQLVRDEATPAAITDAQIAAYFEAHAQDYHRPERRRLVHAVLDSREAAAALRAELVAQEPQAAQTRVALLEALSSAQSVDEKVRAQRGRLPYVTRDDVDALGVAEPLRAAAFGLERFELSEPIALDDGRFAVLLVDGVRPEVRMPLERVAESIRMRLEREPAEQAYDALMQKLRAAADIEVHPEVLEHVHAVEGHAHEH